jgi:hypothetical protein
VLGIYAATQREGVMKQMDEDIRWDVSALPRTNAVRRDNDTLAAAVDRFATKTETGAGSPWTQIYRRIHHLAVSVDAACKRS